MPETEKRDFDTVAAQWDHEPRRVQLARDVVATIKTEVPLTPEMHALDVGCGSGLVTLGLHPHVAHITGADSSQGMLDVLNGKLEQAAIANVSLRYLDLEHEALGERYDLIVSSMTLHHVKDVPALVATLTRALNPAGWLALADLEEEDGSFHDNPTGVLHHGFASDYLVGEFAANGLSEVRAVTAAVMEKSLTRRYPVLLWLGKK